MPVTAIIDYGSGNLRSAQKALERAAAEAGLKTDVAITSDADVVAKAARIVLPGVGAFGDCMVGLNALDGMIDALNEAVLKRSTPFLGICVGMQLLATVGREHGDHEGLGWIPGKVIPLQPADNTMKIPHMGWNELIVTQPEHSCVTGTTTGDHAYFVHSYHFKPADEAAIIARTEYGGQITAAVGTANIFGTQFHPEKSQATGLRILSNFLAWKPTKANP